MDSSKLSDIRNLRCISCGKRRRIDINLRTDLSQYGIVSVFAKAGKNFLAKDTYEDAINLYQTYISSVTPKQKKDWDQLHQYADGKYQELLRKTQ